MFTLKIGNTVREVYEDEIRNMQKSLRMGPLGINDLNLLDAVIDYFVGEVLENSREVVTTLEYIPGNLKPYLDGHNVDKTTGGRA